MKHAAVALVAGLSCALWCAAPACAQNIAPAVLSPEDASAYSEIFAAQEAGELALANRLIAALHDTVLMGYVQHQRYMGRHYITKYSELSEWLSKYADHDGALRIYRLALRKKPQGARNPQGIQRAPWRGVRFDYEANILAPIDSARGRAAYGRLRSFSGDGSPEAAEEAMARLSPADMPASDFDNLMAYVAASYLAYVRDDDARRLAEAELARGSGANSALRWTAGYAAYRMNDYAAAARHFAAMAEPGTATPREHAAGAFWAARAAMRAGNPERVIALYADAASEPLTFYGMLAARLLGREVGFDFSEPALDEASLADLMGNPSIRRAVALHEAGWIAPIYAELGRAFAEIPTNLDPAFAALARALGMPSLELRAGETAAARGIYLTSLYPVTPYQPEGGYRLDEALVLAVARQESRFIPTAESGAGARGLMQIMPATAVHITNDRSLARANRDRLDDPAYSMRLGEDYLRELLDRQNGSLFGLVAAYNAGPGNLSRWLAGHEGNDDPLAFIENLRAHETRDYVKRVMMNFWMYQQRFGQPIEGLDDAAAGQWPIYMAPEAIALLR